jgi:hypothetical protein
MKINIWGAVLARYRRTLAGRLRDDTGAATAYTIVSVLTMVLVAGLVLDAGLALSTKTQAMDVAQSAARAGASELDLATYRQDGHARLDPVRARQAARGWLRAAGFDGEVTATPAQVSVTVHAVRRTQLLALAGLHEIGVSASATASPVRGVTGVEP